MEKKHGEEEQEMYYRLLEAALEAFNEKGAKFTLEDISKRLNISKKTIYTEFSGKQELMATMIDQGFQEVKREEEKIVSHRELSTLEKIRKIVIVIPEAYRNMNFQKIATLQESYPKLYRKIQKYIEQEWDLTIGLFEKGMEEGVLRRFPIPVVKTMIESTMERFLQQQEQEDFDYIKSLEAMMDIVMKGIEKEDGGQ